MKSIYTKEYHQLLELLRTKRIEKGFTQKQLASMLGISQGIISKIETHERRLDIIELRSICKAIGISFPKFIAQLDNILSNDNNKSNR